MSAAPRGHPVSLTLVGDLFLGTGYDRQEADAVRDFLAAQDCAVVNLEGALPAGDARPKAVNLALAEDVMAHLPNTVLSLANNHVHDFGTEGLERTIESAEEAGRPWFGIESRRGAADNYRILEIGGQRILFVGFGWRNEECVPASADAPGVADFTRANIDATFARLASQSYDALLAYVHAGYEFEYFPLPLHVGLSRHLVDRGADVVFASHTHCIQPYERYRDRAVFYGLGNFYFSHDRDRYPPDSDHGAIVNMRLSGNGGPPEIVSASRIAFTRASKGFSIMPWPEFLTEHALRIDDLDAYGRGYRRQRRRKKNPRPILHNGQDWTNSLKYGLWLAAVRVTGYLGVRQAVKKMLGWK